MAWCARGVSPLVRPFHVSNMTAHTTMPMRVLSRVPCARSTRSDLSVVRTSAPSDLSVLGVAATSLRSGLPVVRTCATCNRPLGVPAATHAPAILLIVAADVAGFRTMRAVNAAARTTSSVAVVATDVCTIAVFPVQCKTTTTPDLPVVTAGVHRNFTFPVLAMRPECATNTTSDVPAIPAGTARQTSVFAPMTTYTASSIVIVSINTSAIDVPLFTPAHARSSAKRMALDSLYAERPAIFTGLDFATMSVLVVVSAHSVFTYVGTRAYIGTRLFVVARSGILVAPTRTITILYS